MNVLITGGMGVIGSMVSSLFVQEGYRPVIMGRHLDRSLIRLIEDKVDIELGDILDLPRLLSIIQSYNITHIIHTAAILSELSHKNPPQSIKISVMGTLNVLEAARFMKVQRVVYSSAKGVYGYTRGEYGPPTLKPIPEDYPKNPVTIYAIAKNMCENMGRFYQRTYGLEFVALRYSSTYGPGKLVRHGGKSYISRVVEGAYLGKTVKFQKGGDQKGDIIYNRDTARGIYLACTAPEPHYQAYNIGTGIAVAFKDIASEVKRLIPNADIEIGPGTEGPSNNNVLDITRAREDLGFSPKFSLREAIEDYLETIRKLGF
ncbi:NAD-dependent epimerase/dehydratase family protein [Thermodesulfobacteriota bacterium]